jgi:exodeoxyribonuclease VII large subunit
MQAVDGLEAGLARAFLALLERKGVQLSEFRRALSWLSPEQRLARLDQAWLDASQRLLAAGGRLLDVRRERLAVAVRGLSRAFGPADVATRQTQVQALTERASLAVGVALAGAEGRAQVLAARLAGLNPEGPLTRGYALVRIERTGRFLRSATDVLPGDRLGVRTADGEVAAVVAEDKSAKNVTKNVADTRAGTTGGRA